MNIVFKEIEILNFLSFAKESFDFSANSGINLICGINNDLPDSKNAAGKTAVLESLVFCLFGKTINDIEKERIPNRLADKREKCEVGLNLEVEGKKYRIIRGIKSKNKYVELYEFNSEINKYEDITKSGIKETQKFIEKEIIRCDMSLFLRSILLTADQSYNFFKLKKEQKCEFIEQIFDLVVFGIMYDFLHKDVLKLDKEIFALSREYKILEDQSIDSTAKKLEYDNANIAKKDGILATLKTLKDELEKQANNTTDYSTELVNYTTQKESNLGKIEKLSVRQKAIKEKYHELDKNIEKLKLKISQNTQLIEKHTASLKLLCEDCLVKFDNFYKISELRTEIETYRTEQEKLTEEKTANSTNYSKLDVAIKTLQTTNIEITKNHKDISDKIVIHNNTLSRIKTNISNNEFLLNKLEEDVNPYIDTINTLAAKLTTTNETLDKQNLELDHLKYLEKIISPDMLRRLIIKDLVQYLNNRIRLYISRIGATFTCTFDEALDYTFHTDSGETSYDNFSKGEKMRLSIATSFAFRDFMNIRSCINANILALDEYIDAGLDSSSITNLMNILKEFSIINKYSVYIVSHRKEISETYFNNIITVTKTNGISKISTENLKLEK